MNIRTNVGKCLAGTIVLAALAMPAMAGKKSKPEAPPTEKPTMVDSGSLGVYLNGSRVATETFKIEQSNSGSVVISEFKMEQGQKVQQNSELHMAANGDLQKYSWKESAPGKGQALVEPSGEFLVERVIPDPPEKPSDTPILAPLSTTVLEDYFFSHREVLIWRYMAQACGSTIQSGCDLPKITFGVLVPRQRSQAAVTLEYKGKENVTVKGKPMQLDVFILNTEGDIWSVYMDQNLKLVKIVIPGDKTEVVRD